jgi:DNA polymerase I-like protein with 3'-5' exonuclease and polymerase domains
LLINVDFKAIEWVTALYLSQDPTGMAEWEDVLAGRTEDIHEINQKRFNLGSRIVAKTLLFRIIYGGTIFHTDPDFSHVSRSRLFWDRVVQEFYDKYRGIYNWHKELVQEATTTGKVKIPSGRNYYFSPINGEWPRTQILNYPVQGLGADLVSIARVSLRKRINNAGLADKALFVSSIHDSITLDVVQDAQIQQQVVDMMNNVINDIPLNFKKLFKKEFNIRLLGEIEAGNNKGAVVKWSTRT